MDHFDIYYSKTNKLGLSYTEKAKSGKIILLNEKTTLRSIHAKKGLERMNNAYKYRSLNKRDYNPKTYNQIKSVIQKKNRIRFTPISPTQKKLTVNNLKKFTV